MPGKFFGDANANRKPERLIGSTTVLGTSWDSSQITFSTATATNDTLNITSHGLVNGDQVGFGVPVDGNNTQIPWCGQTSGTILFVVNATTNTFQLSTTTGGTALSFTATGGSSYKLFKNTGITVITFTLSAYKKVRIKQRGWGPVTSGASKPTFRRNGDNSAILNMGVLTAGSSRSDFFDTDVIMEYNNTNGLYTFGFKGMQYVRGQGSSGGVSVNSGAYAYTQRETSDSKTLGTIDCMFYGTGWYAGGTTVEVYAIE